MKGLFTSLAEVGAGSPQAHPQGPGHGGFGPAGVGAAGIARIPAQNPPGPPAVQAHHSGGQDHEEGGQAGRQEVEDVVGPGRHLAEPGIAVIFVPHHAVHGIGGLIEKKPRQAQQQGEEHGGHHAVRQIFRHGFEDRPPDLFRAQLRGFPAHDHGQPGSGLGQVALGQGFFHLAAFLMQAAGGKTGVKEVSEEHGPGHGGKQGRGPQDPQASRQGGPHHRQPEERPRRHPGPIRGRLPSTR